MKKLSELEQNLLNLVQAIERGELLEVKHLLNTGIDVNKCPPGRGKVPPLGSAVAYGHVEIVKALLSAGAYPHGYILLQLSSNSDQKTLEILSLLIDAGINVNFTLEEADTILMKLAAKGDIDSVKLLVEAGANVNQINRAGESALLHATYHPWLEVYEYLAPLTSPELQAEAEKELLSRLIYREREDDILTRDFIVAASYGNLEVVSESIKNGVNINAYNSQGDTALHLASQYGHLLVVHHLIDSGADIQIRDENLGQTPLILATSDLASAKYQGFDQDVIQVICFLIEAGANINAKDNNGWTALIGAANARNAEAVKILLSAGADINAKDNNSNTALTLAKEAENIEIIQLLKEAGAIEN